MTYSRVVTVDLTSAILENLKGKKMKSSLTIAIVL